LIAPCQVCDTMTEVDLRGWSFCPACRPVRPAATPKRIQVTVCLDEGEEASLRELASSLGMGFASEGTLEGALRWLLRQHAKAHYEGTPSTHRQGPGDGP